MWPFFFNFFAICCGFCDGQPHGWSGLLLGEFTPPDIPIKNGKWSPNGNSGCFQIPLSQTAGSWLLAEKITGATMMGKWESVRGVLVCKGGSLSARGSWEEWVHPVVSWPCPAAPALFLGVFCSAHGRGCSTEPAAPLALVAGAGTLCSARPLVLGAPAGEAVQGLGSVQGIGVQGLERGCIGWRGVQGMGMQGLGRGTGDGEEVQGLGTGCRG